MKTQETLIPHEFNGVAVSLRRTDGYMHATAACRACGKNFADYYKIDSTREFLGALNKKTGIPIITEDKKGNTISDMKKFITGNSEPGISSSKTELPTKPLIDIKRGGTPSLQGTWVHPYVAINLAQWADPNFAVQVSMWIVEWTITGQNPIRSEPSQFNEQLFNEFRTAWANAKTKAERDIAIARFTSHLFDHVPVQKAEKAQQIETMLDMVAGIPELQQKHITAINALRSENAEVYRQLTLTQAKLIAYLEAEAGISSGETKGRVSQAESRQIKTLKNQGYSNRQIGRMIGRAESTVRRTLAK